MSLVAVADDTLIGNIEAEAALCGALMFDNALIDPVADILKADDFADALFGRIFTGIVAEHSRGRSATPITLRPLFSDDEGMKELGGPAFLVQLTGKYGLHTLIAKDNARQIRELAQRRRLVTSLQEIIDASGSPDVETAELVASAETAISLSVDEDGSGTELSAAQAVRKHLKAIEEGLPPGVTSGIDALDFAMGPCRAGNLQIMAARPSMGKTAVALNYALGAAMTGHGTLFISLEMSAEQLAARLEAALCFDGHSGIHFSGIENGSLSGDEFRQIARVADRIDTMPLEIIDRPSIRVGSLNRLIRRWKRRMEASGRKLELVVVDYLQLMDADRPNDNRVNEITQISRGLKMVAKANQVAVLALSQLSRAVEQREEKRPKLSDLRESGSIEQDADGVLFLYRPEYYLKQTEPPEGHERRANWQASMDACAGDIEFICAKRRQGQTGIRHGRFFGSFQAVR